MLVSKSRDDRRRKGCLPCLLAFCNLVLPLAFLRVFVFVGAAPSGSRWGLVSLQSAPCSSSSQPVLGPSLSVWTPAWLSGSPGLGGQQALCRTPVYTAASGKTIFFHRRAPHVRFRMRNASSFGGWAHNFFFSPLQRNTKESCAEKVLPPKSISRGLYHTVVGLPFSWSTNFGFWEAGSVRKGEKPSRAASPG